MIRSITVAICIICSQLTYGSVEWNHDFSNHLTVNETKMEVIGDDPYLIYSIDDSTQGSATHFNFQFEQTSPTEEHSIILTLFWNLKHQGFNENQKVNYRLKNPANSMIRSIDLLDLSKEFKFELDELTGIRIDPELKSHDQFQFKATQVQEDQAQLLFYDFSGNPNSLELGLTVTTLNDLAVFNGLLKIMSGDPFIQFDLHNDPLVEGQTIALKFLPNTTEQRFHYMEVFWETSQHGISEKHKAFFSAPTDLKSDQWIELDLFERMRSVEPHTTEITSIRVDFQFPLKSAFKFQISKFSSHSHSANSQIKQTLRYSIKPQWLNSKSTFEHAKRQIWVEFSQRIYQNAWFFALYLILMFMLVSIFTIYLSKRSMSRKK